MSYSPAVWDEVQRLYRAGAPARQIARTVPDSPSHTAILKRARVQGWKQDLGQDIRSETNAQLQAEDAARVLGTSADELHLLPAADVVRAAARGAVEVVQGHRALTSDLHGIVLVEIQHIKECQVDGEIKGQEIKRLAETIEKLIRMERQAYGLTDDAPEHDTPEGMDDDALDARIAELEREVGALQPVG
ncbi:MAG: hypothetical protein AB7E47_02345 [Desulfovibrionaceae bacterium]